MPLKKRGKIYHYEFMHHGQRYWGTTRSTSKTRAETVLAEKILEAQSTGTIQREHNIPTLKAFSERFLKFIEAQSSAQQLDPDTVRYYTYGWKLLETSKVAAMRIDKIGRSDAAILQFQGSASYANQAFRTLRRMLNLAVEWQLIKAAPKIKTLEERGRTSLIESSQEALLLECASQPLRDLLIVMMDAGLRPEEAMRMRWEHILWDRSVMLIPYGKTLRSRRYVPLSDRIRVTLRARAPKPKEHPCEVSPIEWVFPSKTSKCGHLTTVAKMWNSTVDRANAKARKEKRPPLPGDLVLYCARHTFATDMLQHLDLAQVKELMGHSSVSTTMKYLHPKTSGASDAVNKRNSNRGLHLVSENNSDKNYDIAVAAAVS